MAGISDRFIIREEVEDTSTSLRLVDTERGFAAVVVPGLGGMLHSVTATVGNKMAELLDRYTTLANAKLEITTSYKGSNLAPFPNRVKGGRYRFGGRAYQLPINLACEHNAIHGLLYNRAFSLTDTWESSTGCSLTLAHRYQGDIDGYPFPFQISLIYNLAAEDGLRCTTTCTNLHETAIPVGHGFHPYFSLDSDTIDELLLEFAAEKKLELVAGIPTGKELPCSAFSKLTALGRKEFDDCYRLAQENRAVTRLYNPDKGIEVQIWQEAGPGKYNYLQIYTPPHRKAIAIEPMSCAPDAFNNGLGLICLEPGQSCTFSWGIRVIRED